MKENFLSLELSKKLHECGFTLKHPFAMYDEHGRFYALFTSADKNKDNKSIFGNRDYYIYDYFDCNDIPAPTIEQALKWLREEKKIYIVTDPFPSYSNVNNVTWVYKLKYNSDGNSINFKESIFCFESYEEATTAGIEYALNNMIRPCSTDKE